MSNKKNKKKMETRLILKSCEDAYNKSGVQGAIDEAKRQKVKTYKRCVPCDAEQPMVASYCCVCGSKNK